MSGNSFGTMFRVTTFGESHGPAVGVVIDGCPPRLPITVEEIQVELDRRRPGQSAITTQRREADTVSPSTARAITDLLPANRKPTVPSTT